MEVSLRPRKEINYKVMHHGEPMEEALSTSLCTRTIVLKEVFYVERIIWRRRIPGQTGFEYLIKWKDFPISDSTWEPESHIPSYLLQEYIPRAIDTNRAAAFNVSFERAVQKRLSSRNPKTEVFVDLDVYRSHFGEHEQLFDLKDFEKMNLPANWYYRLDKDGTGRKLRFPIKLTPRLHVRKIYVKEGGKLVQKSTPTERCIMYSCTEACVLDNL